MAVLGVILGAVGSVLPSEGIAGLAQLSGLVLFLYGGFRAMTAVLDWYMPAN